MSRLCRVWLSLLVLAVFLPAATGADPVQGHYVSIGQHSYTVSLARPTLPTPDAVADPVQLADSPQARQKLSAAQDYARARAWPEAVRLIQALLDAPSDSFRPVTSRDGRGRPRQRWVSIRREAEQLLARLPPAGKDFYRVTYEATARKLLADARARRDLTAFQEVARRYRHTRAGTDALDFLGSYYLDRGHHDLAAACYRRLLHHPSATQLAPLTFFKAALALRDSPGQREEAWRTLVDRIGERGLRIGNDTFDTDKLRQLIDRWPAGAAAADSLLYRGDPRRSGRGVSDSFLLEPQWRVTTAEGEGRSWLTRAVQTSPDLVLPAAVPIGVDGLLAYRSHDGIHALDVSNGRERWRRPSPVSLESVLHEPGKKVQVQNWLSIYGPDRAVLAENATIGTLSSDGRLIYAVEDLPLPPPPGLVQNDAGQSRSLGPLRHAAGHNRLLALDAGTGRMIWEIGGPGKQASGRGAPRTGREPPLADTYFLGPPLPLGGQLFVLAEKQQEVSLVCLDPQRGTVRWTQVLAIARDKMLLDVPRRTRAAHLAYADGILVCPTGSGAVLGVDPLSRTLVWAHVYARPAAAAEDAPGANPARVRGGWRACAPILHGGRVLFTAPDSDALSCLDLHDGSLLWKAARGAEDLYVGCVHKGQVLVVGKTSCRALSLAGGQTLWQRSTGQPSGQGVAAGPIYYLPLKQGAILALNLEVPRDSARIASRPTLREPPGNLLFHRGILWSQGLTSVTAFTSPATQLARIERRLARSPHDPAVLFERGSLRLDRGDVTGAAADLHAALAERPSAALRPQVRGRLFAALTQLLQRDFTAGEKYLDEYHALCKVTIPADAEPEQRLALEREQHHRQSQALALVALGREKQGRVLDALQAYRELSRRTTAGPKGGEWMTVPDDPAVSVRPDLWVQARIAALLTSATPPPRRLLEGQVRREWRALSSGSERAGLRRFLALSSSSPGAAGALAQEARLRLARDLGRFSVRRRALEAEFLLHDLRLHCGSVEGPSDLEARALYEHARLLTRHGLLDEAVAHYRRLARDHGRTVVHDGKTGAELFDDLLTDKRFLAHLEPPPNPWTGALKPSVLSGGSPPNPLVVPCLPCRALRAHGDDPTEDNSRPPLELVSEIPASCRNLRFMLDGQRLRLRVASRTTGAELYTIPLPLTGLPPYLHDGEVCYQAVDHLLVLCVGPTLLGVDLIDRKVRWSRHVPDPASPPVLALSMVADGSLLASSMDRRVQQWMGLNGPVGASGVYLHNQRGLTALDPASGEVRWTRSDVPITLSVFGDGQYLFLVDYSGEDGGRDLRAIRASDGISVPIPDGAGSYAHRRRILGRHLLVHEEEPRGDRLRLYDALTGKDVWQMTAPAHSLVLECPDPRWLGVAAPDGTVTVIDLPSGRQAARLLLDPRHLAKVHNGYLLADREGFYVALNGPTDPPLNDPSPNFHGGLTAVPVHGMFYAFDRGRGGLRWFAWLPAQAILLDHFAELPVVLCSAVTDRTNGAAVNPLIVTATRSLDKRTGKLLLNRQTAQAGELFHTLRIDPRTGTIDLIGPSQKVRHSPLRPAP